MSPVRTCVGCRQRANSSDLLRVSRSVSNPSELLADLSASNPGRGAWIHPSQQCLSIAIERRAFGRALKTGEALDASGLFRSIEGAEKMLASNE